MFVCQTCKGTALILAVESDGRLCFEECPDCNPHPESRLPIFEDNWKAGIQVDSVICKAIPWGCLNEKSTASEANSPNVYGLFPNLIYNDKLPQDKGS